VVPGVCGGGAGGVVVAAVVGVGRGLGDAVRVRAKNPTGSVEYYQEPYTVQHFADWLRQLVGDVFLGIPSGLWYVFRHYTSKAFRMEQARAYNRLMFGNIPTSQIYVTDGDRVRPLREEERTWPE
jgi:hypothetical protein